MQRIPSPSSMNRGPRKREFGYVREYQEPQESPWWGCFMWEKKLDDYLHSQTGADVAVRLLGELAVMRRA